MSTDRAPATIRGAAGRVARFVIVMGFALSVVGLPIASSGAAVAKATVSILSCQSRAEVKPASFVISCADTNSYLQHIHWSTWSPTTAIGSATYTANNCTPYCAAGRFISYVATVKLSDPKHFKPGELFTELAVRYRSGKKTVAFNFSLLT